MQVLSRVRRCKSGCGEVKQDTTLKKGFGLAKKGVARCCIEGCVRIGKEGIAQLLKVFLCKVGR
jgi:hypothetical protein